MAVLPWSNFAGLLPAGHVLGLHLLQQHLGTFPSLPRTKKLNFPISLLRASANVTSQTSFFVVRYLFRSFGDTIISIPGVCGLRHGRSKYYLLLESYDALFDLLTRRLCT